MRGFWFWMVYLRNLIQSIKTRQFHSRDKSIDFRSQLKYKERKVRYKILKTLFRVRQNYSIVRS